jgi:L-threonylcarbamoyladenylate synthase
METRLVDDEGTHAATVSALCAGEVVVVPTDTVYGLAAVPHDAEAVSRIFLAKSRPQHLHLPVLAASLAQIERLGVDVSSAVMTLAEKWWPGPLTMVLGFAEGAARPGWLAGREEVAGRVPRHRFLLEVMEQTGVLLVTSANQHGAGTPPSADEIAQMLGAHVSLIVDGGTLDTVPSTVVNVRGGAVTTEREGAIPADDILNALAQMP